MKKISALFVMSGLIVLSGCNHYSDDCDERAGNSRRPNYTAITSNECVPAPAPIASVQTPAPAKAIVEAEVKPIVVVPESKPVVVVPESKPVVAPESKPVVVVTESKPVVVVPESKPVAKPAPRDVQPAPVSIRSAGAAVRELRSREEFSYENASSF